MKTTIASALIGGFFGWIAGYFVILNRAAEIDNPIAQLLLYTNAATAPDAIFLMLVGMYIGTTAGTAIAFATPKDGTPMHEKTFGAKMLETSWVWLTLAGLIILAFVRW